MKLIPTNKENVFGIVDDEDYERVIQANPRWSVDETGRLSARVAWRAGFKRQPTRLQFWILRVRRLVGQNIDHINHNPLDNRKENLRIVDFSESSSNRRQFKSRLHDSKYKNVYWHEPAKLWHVLISFRGKQISGGYFKTQDEAAIKANELIKQIHQEYGVINDITKS